MSITKRIVCLANSRKLQGRCIAGKEWTDGKVGSWIRPVSAREHQEVSEYERQYENGEDPCVFDIVYIPLVKPLPQDYQSENWLLDPDSCWKKTGLIDWKDLSTLLDPVETLWIDGHSTYNGRNDKIPLSLAERLKGSLRFIQVEKLTLKVFSPGEAFGNSKRRVQGIFRYAEQEYSLWVTDPNYERTYLKKNDGLYALDRSFLTVSLGEPYKGDCYKLIATVIPHGGRGG